MYRFVVILLLGCIGYTAQAQRAEIVGIADIKPGKIRLRWAPSDYIAWQMGNKYGYTIERFTVAADRQRVSWTVKPYDLSQLKNAALKDPQVDIIAELIYNTNRSVSPEDGVGAYFDQQGQNDWRMGMALLSCDLSMNLATCAGLYFEDSSIQKGEQYVYRVSLAKQPVNLKVDAAVLVPQTLLLSPPRELSIVCRDSVATLGWLTRYAKGMYSAYQVERSRDGKVFKPVTALPVLPAGPDKAGFSYYQDSLPDNDRPYKYRIRGMSPFGEYGPYSAIVTGTGIAEINDRPVMDTMIVRKTKVELHWSAPKELKQIIITRADNANGPFKAIAVLAGNATVFTDSKPLASNYYKINAVGKQGQQLHSFPYFAQVIDITPPATPVGLRGSIDSVGIVQLHWDVNTESDFQGYRVFRANGLKEDFTEVTCFILSEPVFTDTVTLHTLTPRVYYTVIAVDKNYNTSAYCPYLGLRRPDTVAPVPPVMTKGYRVDSLNAIVLEWRNSSSADVAGYTLYRIDVKDSTRKLVAHPQGGKYSDNVLMAGHTYYYELEVSDSSGNHASVLSGDIWFETGRRPAIQTFNAWKINRTVQLEWEYDAPDVIVFRIYRAKNDEPFILYAAVRSEVRQWNDQEIFLGNTYKYKIMAILKGGVRTRMTKMITVKY
jgi:uncharacterized protein